MRAKYLAIVFLAAFVLALSGCGHENHSSPIAAPVIITDENVFNNGKIELVTKCGFTIQLGYEHAIVTDSSGYTYSISCDTLLTDNNGCQFNVFNSPANDPTSCN